jgi:serine/threonine-protein kinase
VPQSADLVPEDERPERAQSGDVRAVAGRYEIVALLGVGGMGSVYKARDLELDELVALKMIRAELVASAGALERFRREVKLARRIAHPGVARTFDIGEYEGERFLTMELVDGESLAKALAREGALPPARCVEVALMLCDALAAAHAVGVVHCDLSPTNVLLEKGGRVVITDFGVARAASMAVAAPGEVPSAAVGTPAYMAPEQVLGQQEIDARADVYALGAVLYEMCTGERAWQGASPFAVAAARLLEPPPDPRERRAEVPPALARIVLRCLARRPEDRYKSADAVARELTVAAAEVLPAPIAHPPPLLPLRPLGETTTLAVLPLTAASPEDATLADVLTDDLIDRCSMTRGLRVRPSAVVQRHRGSRRDPRELGRELGVQAVVAGSVVRETAGADRVAVSLRLHAVEDGFQLWAARFERADTDLLGLNDEAARGIAAALAIEEPIDERDRVPDALALELYLRGRSEYRRFWPENVERATHLFERALARAPEAPALLAGWAMARARWAHFAGDGLDSARDAAEEAVRRAPQLAEARLALALIAFQTTDTVAAARELRLAIARAPGLAEAHLYLGRMLVEIGRVDEGIVRLRAAIDLDQLDFGLRELARTYELCGERARADAILDAPPEPGSRETFRVDRARAAVWRRDTRWAAHCLEELDAKSPSRGPAAIAHALASLVARGTDPRDHAEFLVPATAPPRTRRRAFLHQIHAEVAAFLGDHDQTIDHIQRSVEAGLIDRLWLDGCPLLDEIRLDPRLRAAHAELSTRAEKILAALADDG